MALYIFLLYFSSLLFFVLSQKEVKSLKRDLNGLESSIDFINTDTFKYTSSQTIRNYFGRTLVSNILQIRTPQIETLLISDTINVGDFVYWPNATIPFYINPLHFDKEQSLAIMSVLAMYAFKTCLQFNPVMAEPGLNQHVISFENPGGVRKCVVGMEGHAKEDPHRIILGYDCLKTPQIDMLLMKALGFPFEHNRASRDVYIDVQFENIEIGSIPLFTKEKILPSQLRALPYDVDSVMHFGERDFSKNGHRTIIFKSEKIRQNRIGLSKLDLRKIDIVYGPECLKRERQAKIDICKNYPVVRKKRSIDLATVGSLRVNPEITPPPDVLDQKNLTEETMNNLKELGIENDIQVLIDQIHKITATALENSKLKHCSNNTVTSISNNDSKKIHNNETSPDLTEIVNTVDKYVANVVHNALVNLTIFCDSLNSMEMFQRVRCGWGTNNRCPGHYKSTLPGLPKYSTQHRPIIIQSTKHEGRGKKRPYVSLYGYRKDADATSNLTRRKRDIESNKVEDVTKVTEMTTKVSQDDVKNNLRMATKIISDKKMNYAPVRRTFREFVSKDEDNQDASDIPQEKQRKKSIQSRIPEPKQKLLKIQIKPSRDHEKASQKNNKEYTDNQEIEERKTDQKKRIRKERIRTVKTQIVNLSKENKAFYTERKWPDGIVKYVIQENVKYNTEDVRARLAEVNKILRRRTCVRLKEIPEENDRDTDYLVLDTSRDYVTGRVGGKQNFGSLELFEGGQHRQHAAMLVMAMLGFYFEVSRHDRDKYIRIHNRHIRPDKLHHFEKIRSEATFPLPYDYTSATHPAWQFWRKIGKTGISTVATYKDQDPDGFIMKSLGQNAQLLSDTDIIKINSVYGVECFQNQRRMKIKSNVTVE